MQIHTLTVAEGARVNRTPPQNFWYVAVTVSKGFFLKRKAFGILNKMRYILQVMALLEASDVTNDDRHLGFSQEKKSG